MWTPDPAGEFRLGTLETEDGGTHVGTTGVDRVRV